jgi:uncharacterized protein (TIGR03435 family)
MAGSRNVPSLDGRCDDPNQTQKYGNGSTVSEPRASVVSMNRHTPAAIAWAIMATVTLRSQTNEEPPVFDVASVKPCDENAQGGTMMQEKSGSLYYRRVNLQSVMRRAYNVDVPQIDGPSWLGSDCYDFHARFPENTPVPRMQQMLRNLLVERFVLKVHMENRELTAFDLVLAKGGIKMRPSEGGQLGYGPSRTPSGHRLAGKITLPVLAMNLSGIVGRPVADQTGLSGLYDLDLSFSFPDAPQNGEAFPPIETALREQLGLKLEARKAHLDVVVIDSVERKPIAN